MQRFPQLYGNAASRQQDARGRSSSIDTSGGGGDNSSFISSTSASTSSVVSTGTSGLSSSTQSRRGNGRGHSFGANPRFAKGKWGGGGRRASSSSFSGRRSYSVTPRPASRPPPPRALAPLPSGQRRGADDVITESDPRIRGSAMLVSGRTREEQDILDADDERGDAEEGGHIRWVASEEEWITCVTESKGSGHRTVGIAAFQPSTATCTLTQLNDSQTYVKTTHTLGVRWPSIILTPGAASLGSGKLKALDPSAKSKVEETLLLKALQGSFGAKQRARGGALPERGSRAGSVASSSRFGGGGEEGMQSISAGDGVEIAGLARRFFDANAGLNFVSELIINNDDTAATLAAMQGKYYALSAVAALFKFIEMTSNTTFAAGSIKIQYAPLEGTMLIDGESAKNLELVENIMDRRSRQCLFGFLNHCFTPMAIRLLRTNILSPLTDAATIDTRLDAVAELLANHERFRALRKAMKGLQKIDADKLTGTILASASVNANAKMQNRKTMDAAKESERKLSVVLQLRTFLKAIPNIKHALKEEGGCQSKILSTISDILGDERLKEIENEIQDTLNENMLESMTKTSLSARTSRVFAIRAEKKKLLDVARETFKENIADVDELLKELQEKYPDILDNVDLQYSPSNGFTFALPENTLEEKGLDLPRMFNKLNKKGKKIVFSCVDLLKRNQRIQQSLDEVFLLSSDVLDELFEAIRKNIAALYRTSEVIAMLDMLCAFTNVATSNASYTRPEFTDTLAIKDGRHPVLEKYASDKSFVPNDTYATEAASFQLLTGPNMSGKTTFLKQIALLVVMSQIGSYVPAEYASFRLHNALLTRLSNDDSIEGNLSTFALEMKTMGMILSALQSCDNALVIVDELGRGTSPQEGVGIAHAIAEDIIRHKSFCFFATHFHDLSTTLSMYPNVVSLHLETDMTELQQGAASTSLLTSSKEFNMTFSHRVRDGVTLTPNYGLEIAKVAALPEFMLEEARLATAQLMNLYELRKKDAVGTKLATRRKTILDVAGRLRQAFNSHKLADEDLAKYISKINDEAIDMLSTEEPEEEMEMDNMERDDDVHDGEAAPSSGAVTRTMGQESSRGQATGATYSHMLLDDFDDLAVNQDGDDGKEASEGEMEAENERRSPTPIAQQIETVRPASISPVRGRSVTPRGASLSPAPDANRIPLFAPRSPGEGELQQRSPTYSPEPVGPETFIRSQENANTFISPFSSQNEAARIVEQGRRAAPVSYSENDAEEMDYRATQSQTVGGSRRILAGQSYEDSYEPPRFSASQPQASTSRRAREETPLERRERLSSETLRRLETFRAPPRASQGENQIGSYTGSPSLSQVRASLEQMKEQEDDQGTEVMSDAEEEEIVETDNAKNEVYEAERNREGSHAGAINGTWANFGFLKK